MLQEQRRHWAGETRSRNTIFLIKSRHTRKEGQGKDIILNSWSTWIPPPPLYILGIVNGIWCSTINDSHTFWMLCGAWHSVRHWEGTWLIKNFPPKSYSVPSLVYVQPIPKSCLFYPCNISCTHSFPPLHYCPSTSCLDSQVILVIYNMGLLIL